MDSSRVLLAPVERTSSVARLLMAAAGDRTLDFVSGGPAAGLAPGVVLLAAGADAAARAAATHAARPVLDADDPTLQRLSVECRGAITWCSLDARNPLVVEHLDRGSDACVLDQGQLWLCAGPAREAIADVVDLPFALGGAARDRLGEALLAIGAAVALDLTLASVRAALKAEPAPARFVLGGATVLLDPARDASEGAAALRTIAGLPAERRRWLSPGHRIPAEPTFAGVLGPGETTSLEAALTRTQPGDLLLVLAGEAEPRLRARLEALARAGWVPGEPLPQSR